MIQSAEVVIIGSGMGGATAALALAQRGIEVLVLERGQRLPREPQNWSPGAVFGQRRYRTSERWVDGHGDGFSPGVHYHVGGNTKVYGASLPRLREADFGALEHHEGVSPAWPLTYAELEPHYARAEQIYGVHGNAGEDPTEPWRSGPFPFPALEHEPYISALAQRLRVQGVTPCANAMAVDWRPGGGCVRRRTCDGFPCLRAAKGDAEVRAVDPALATGHARLATGVRVRRLIADRSGMRVDRLLADGPEGPIEVRGERYVLAAGAVNSAALLLASADARHPRGLANGSDQVGRNFMMHNNAHIVAVDLHRRNDVRFQKTLSVNDFYLDGGDGRPLGTMQLIGKVQGVMMRASAPRLVPLPLLDLVASRSVEWLIMAEDLPDPANRVTVTAPGAITTARSARGTSTHERLIRRARALLRGAGYEVVLVQRFDISMNSHQCGTARAGTDPDTSVLDPWGRAHELDNLWVLDASFFPSSAAMNPALTIAAVALRAVTESPLGGSGGP